ncbi:MAG: RNA-binding protein [Sandaracinaceae bacterium]|nr:RNA-binding protein [Sandaracinaceae bacterium]
MGSRLFVGNLPYSCTDDDLRGLFEPRWIVRDVRIVTDRETGRSRGFAFVELASDDDAREAIEALEGREIGGRRLSVREAHERSGKPQRRQASGGRRPEVEAVVRRGAGSFRDARSRSRDDGRLWHAPPEPSGVDWGVGPREASEPDRDDTDG